MDSLSQQFNSLSITTNFELIGHSRLRPRAPQPHIDSINAMKTTLYKAFIGNLYPSQIEYILHEKRRSDITSIESIEEDFFKGDLPYRPMIKDNHYVHALDYIHRQFAPPQKVRPVHFLDIEHHYPHENSSNAEAPFSTEKFFTDMLNDPTYRERHNIPENAKKSFGNMKPIIFDWTRRFLHEIKDGTASFNKYMYHIQLHNKTALIDKTDENKIRSISGFPRPANLACIMFLWPLFAYYKRYPGQSPLLWGYETILGGMLRLNHELWRSHHHASIVTLDKSRFDKYYAFEIQDDIDTIVESYIDFDHGYIPTKEYSNTHLDWDENKTNRLFRLWKWICYVFRNTPTVIHDGRMYKRKWFGMPSGIYTVQYYDTLHFGITNSTVLFSMGFTESDILIYKGEGDDILLQLAIIIPPNQHDSFLQEYQRIDDHYFGSVIRPDKCEIVNGIDGFTTLGYTNHKGLPHRNPLDLLAQFYHTKHTDPSAPRTMATAVGIAYASLGRDKQVYRVCRDVYEYLASQGFTPDEEALRRTLWTGEPYNELPSCAEFPTILDIQRNILDFNYGPPKNYGTLLA